MSRFARIRASQHCQVHANRSVRSVKKGVKVSLSVVISWRDRKELGRCVESLSRMLNGRDAEIIVVNLGGTRELLNVQIAGFENIKIVEKESEWFNKPLANNIGAHAARGDYLFFCDCDILFENAEFLELYDMVCASNKTFGTLAGVRETDPNSRGGRNVACFGYELNIRIANGASVRIVDNEEDIQDGTRQAPGLLLVKRNDFDAVGGYNSALDGWGWEDQDMICRLILHTRLERVNYGKVFHISHSDEARLQAFPMKDRWESRDRMFRRALNNYDEGRFTGTYAMDVL